MHVVAKGVLDLTIPPRGVLRSPDGQIPPTRTEDRMSPSTDRTYTVQGMTCSHCVLSVQEEVAEVPGVQDVDVDLASGRMIVTGTDVADEAVRTAVADAGYQVVS
jgi:copper chaperone